MKDLLKKIQTEREKIFKAEAETKKAKKRIWELRLECNHENSLWVHEEDNTYHGSAVYACPDCLLCEKSWDNGSLKVFANFKGKLENKISWMDFVAPYEDKLSLLMKRCQF